MIGRLNGLLFILARGLYTTGIADECLPMPSFGLRLRSSLKDRWFLVLFGLSVAALACDIGLLMWKLPGIAETHDVVTIHYNVFFGVDWVGPWYWGYGAPVFGFCVLFVNSILAVVLHPTEWFVSRLLLAMAWVVNMLLVLAALFFILANL